ncbi:MAG: ATP-binding protein [Terricaulis sp.]
MSSAELPRRGLWQRLGLSRRLDLVYFILAGFDVLTLCIALLLNHIATTAFEAGVRTSAVWSARQADVIQLSRLAKEANAPGNEVFFSRQPRQERAVFEAALARFNTERPLVVERIESNPISNRDRELLRQIALIQSAVDEMAAQTNVIFSQFSRGDERDAGRNMAVLDRAFHVLLGRLDDALAAVETGRAEHLEQQLSRVQELRTLEIIIGSAVIVIVCFVALYGSYIGRTLRTNEAQRAHMLSEVAAARDRLQHYANDVSHELRGPISKMRLDAEVLLRQERAADQYRDGIESILMEAQRLSTIVESLLFLARADNSAMTVQTTQLDAKRELEVIAEFFRPAAEEAGIRLTVKAANVTVWADRSLFQRAVSNLLSNALKHGAGGSRIDISARLFPWGTLVEVNDDGPGISDDMLARVFDRFQRADASAEGLGLGLAIVKGVMDVHGGSIDLSSGTGTGLVARMTFPEKRTLGTTARGK